MHRILILAAAAALLAACGSGSSAMPGTGPERSIPVGIAANVDGFGSIPREVGRVRATGTHWLREDLPWSQAEPRRGHFDWSGFDAIVSASAARGMHVLPILDASPCWATPAGTASDVCSQTLPAGDAEFARFVTAAVQRYGPGGDFWKAHPEFDSKLAIETWEVWNEPYLASGALPVSGERYAQVFAAAATAGKAVAPNTSWLFAAAGKATRPDGSQFDWLPAVAASDPGVAKLIDGFAIHVYPEVDDGATLDATRGTLSVLATARSALGIDKPAWITELGFAACVTTPTVNPCVPGASRSQREATKAKLIATAIAQIRSEPRIAAVFLYTLHEFADNPFHGDVGLIAPDGAKLPAYAAFARSVG